MYFGHSFSESGICLGLRLSFTLFFLTTSHFFVIFLYQRKSPDRALCNNFLVFSSRWIEIRGRGGVISRLEGGNELVGLVTWNGWIRCKARGWVGYLPFLYPLKSLPCCSQYMYLSFSFFFFLDISPESLVRSISAFDLLDRVMDPSWWADRRRQTG